MESEIFLLAKEQIWVGDSYVLIKIKSHIFGKDTLKMGKEKIVENLNLLSNPRRKTP